MKIFGTVFDNISTKNKARVNVFVKPSANVVLMFSAPYIYPYKLIKGEYIEIEAAITNTKEVYDVCKIYKRLCPALPNGYIFTPADNLNWTLDVLPNGFKSYVEYMFNIYGDTMCTSLAEADDRLCDAWDKKLPFKRFLLMHQNDQNIQEALGIYTSAGLNIEDAIKAAIIIHDRLTERRNELYLNGLGLPYETIFNLIHRFPPNSDIIELVTEDPWIFYNMGLMDYDSNATTNIELTSERTVSSICANVKRQIIKTGKFYIPEKSLKTEDAEILKIQEDNFYLNKNVPIVRVYIGKNVVYQDKNTYEKESSICNLLKKISETNNKNILRENSVIATTYTEKNPDEILRDGRELVAKYESLFGASWIEYDSLSPIRAAATLYHGSGISLLTGLPGSGKTTLIRLLAMLNLMDGRDVYLLSFTGKAVKKIEDMMSEVMNSKNAKNLTGKLYMSTVHKYISNTKNKKLKSICKKTPVFITDECTMLDYDIFDEYLKKLPENSRIIFAGDTGQISGIGIGEPFKEMLDSGVFEHVYIEGTYRYKNPVLVDIANHIRNSNFSVFSVKNSEFGNFPIKYL